MLKYLLYLGVVAAIVEAIQRAPEGEAVAIPEIRGIRVGKRSYALRGAQAVPEVAGDRG
jgi:hypothetical protein